MHRGGLAGDEAQRFRDNTRIGQDAAMAEPWRPVQPDMLAGLGVVLGMVGRNLAVDYRMIGEFDQAYLLDQEIAARWKDVGASDPRALAAYINLARSCYGLGAYRLGLQLLEQWQSRPAAGAGSFSPPRS